MLPLRSIILRADISGIFTKKPTSLHTYKIFESIDCAVAASTIYSNQQMEGQRNTNRSEGQASQMSSLAGHVMGVRHRPQEGKLKKVEAAEMWLNRRLLGVKWTNNRMNCSILSELKGSREILDVVSKRRLKYVGHAIQNKNTNLRGTVL
ncbi:endonuclease-reverse transcriptase [Elysia marginata]|uniref:Endonuclease-reverse transcriptase n=1 Tax=Elysia marginata TaxID=1093978 RepID=A0AAV4JKM0_9GAST|nr:endonuclease-reverse transcriptase [Elysia marginata]